MRMAPPILRRHVRPTQLVVEHIVVGKAAPAVEMGRPEGKDLGLGFRTVQVEDRHVTGPWKTWLRTPANVGTGLGVSGVFEWTHSLFVAVASARGPIPSAPDDRPCRSWRRRPNGTSNRRTY